MNGVAQIKEIEKKAKKRISILRILSQKTHWKVNENVLVNIYKSLVRSIIDYSAYLSYLIKDTNMEHGLSKGYFEVYKTKNKKFGYSSN